MGDPTHYTQSSPPVAQGPRNHGQPDTDRVQIANPVGMVQAINARTASAHGPSRLFLVNSNDPGAEHRERVAGEARGMATSGSDGVDEPGLLYRPTTPGGYYG